VLDLYHNRYVATEVAQYDINSRELIITITNKGQFYKIENDILVKIKYSKSDGKKVLNDCDILGDGTVKVKITDQMTIASGRCDAELMLLKNDTKQVLHSMHFVVNVIKSVFSNEEIESTDEFIALENALLKVDDASKKAEEFVELSKQIEANENVRKSNETTRINNENARITSETKRNTDENTRQENEATRILNENERKQSELERKENEKSRIAVFGDMRDAVENAVENGKAYSDSKEIVSGSEPVSQIAGDFWLLEY
jgi:hypothetical protein